MHSTKLGRALCMFRLGILGRPEEQLVYNPVLRTFEESFVPALEGDSPARLSQGCATCLKDLLKNVVCEAIASAVSCATVVACPGALLSAVIRATWKALTQDLCVAFDVGGCLAACAVPRITLTPASNAQLNPGQQKITVNISGTNSGAWALPVPQNGSPGTPLIKLGGNPRNLDWNPAAGVYTIYAGNIPLASAPGMVRSTNVTVGQGATGRVSWTINDRCDDGRGIRVRFFDKTRGGAFPSQGYVAIPSGGQRTLSFDAPRGSRICLGAVKDPPTSQWWCYGIDGNQDGSYSATCCSVVPGSGNLDLANNLICD